MTENRDNFLDDLINGGNADCGKPYYPQPTDDEVLNRPDGNFFLASSKDVESIDGTQLEFGCSESRKVDNNGNTTRIKNNKGHILGDGLLVIGLKPTNKDGIELPGVGGVCKECYVQAYNQYKAGLIDLKTAQQKSCFSTKSGAQCYICRRRNICEYHCPKTNVDGHIVTLCPDCRKEFKDSKWVSQALNSVYELFKGEPQPKLLPPGQQE